jgi:hypothetical protein
MAGAFPLRPGEATVLGIAHQVKPDGGFRGAVRTMGLPKKCGWPPAALPSGCRSRHLQGSSVRTGTAGVRDGVLRGVNSPPADARPATKSTMNQNEGAEFEAQASAASLSSLRPLRETTLPECTRNHGIQ